MGSGDTMVSHVESEGFVLIECEMSLVGESRSATMHVTYPRMRCLAFAD